MFEHQRNLFDESHPQEMSWREKYKLVISSKRWRLLRDRFLDKQDGKCFRCGWHEKPWDRSKSLELHHRTYERLGQEIDSDLELLCSDCHIKADKERALQARIRSDRDLYRAQFHGWASKVYGDNYEVFEDESMHLRFEEWKDREQRDL